MMFIPCPFDYTTTVFILENIFRLLDLLRVDFSVPAETDLLRDRAFRSPSLLSLYLSL